MAILELGDRKEIKTTKAADKVQRELRDFQKYYKQSTGANPTRIIISQQQKKTLGVDTPFLWDAGISLELR